MLAFSCFLKKDQHFRSMYAEILQRKFFMSPWYASGHFSSLYNRDFCLTKSS